MTQPHHHVFNALEALFHRKVPILPLIPVLIEKGVITPNEEEWFRDEQNGIRILTGYLRSRDYPAFVGFVEAVLEAGTQAGATIDFGLMKSVKEVLADFDKRFKTAHAQPIGELIDSYSRKAECVIQDSDSVSDQESAVKRPTSELILQYNHYDVCKYSYKNLASQKPWLSVVFIFRGSLKLPPTN